MRLKATRQLNVLGASALLTLAVGVVAGNVSAAPLPPEPLPQIVPNNERIELLQELNQDLNKKALASEEAVEENPEAAALDDKRKFVELAEIQSWDAWSGEQSSDAPSDSSSIMDDVSGAMDPAAAPSSGAALSGEQEELFMKALEAAAVEQFADAAEAREKVNVDPDLSDFTKAEQKNALKEALAR